MRWIIKSRLYDNAYLKLIGRLSIQWTTNKPDALLLTGTRDYVDGFIRALDILKDRDPLLKDDSFTPEMYDDGKFSGQPIATTIHHTAGHSRQLQGTKKGVDGSKEEET